MVRAPKAEMKFVGGVFSYEVDAGADGTWCDWWHYEDLQRPLLRVDSAAAFARDEITVQADHLGRHAHGLLGPEGAARGHGRQPRRGVAVRSRRFPRFCGQTFLERQGQGARRPLREGLQRLDGRRVVRAAPAAASSRCRSSSCGTPSSRPPRCAATRRAACARSASARSRRSSACRRCTTPTATGTRSSGACAETGTVVYMHIGSSSKMPSTSADAPAAVGSTLTYMNAAMSLTDCLMSGIFERFPKLKVAYSRGPDRLDPVRPRARRQGVGGQPRLGRRRRQGAASRRRSYY